MASCIPFAATTHPSQEGRAPIHVVAYEIQHGRRCNEIEAIGMAQDRHGCRRSGPWSGSAGTRHQLHALGERSHRWWPAGNYADFTYWGPAGTAAGVNKKAVNWDGYNSISNQNYLVRNALDCYCTGSNWCYIGAHSAGNLQVGYTLAMYGGSSRTITNASPNSSGVCGASGAGTQTGWNIKWVDIAGGAAGGSELADAGSWALSEPLVSDLKTSTSRAMYDHNQTRGKIFYMFAGAKGTLYSGILPGQDDEAIAYHPAAAYRARLAAATATHPTGSAMT